MGPLTLLSPRWGEGWNQGELGVGGVGAGSMMDIFE